MFPDKMRFEVMYQDVHVASVLLTREYFKIKTYGDFDCLENPFKYMTEPQQIYDYFEDRLLPKSRCTPDMLLHGFGITEYDPWIILRENHGIDSDEFVWFNFEGQNTTYEEIKHVWKRMP